MDQYFRRSHQESDAGRHLFRNKNPFAVIALGGYGRKDLCLFSDIDVMILFNSRVPLRPGSSSRTSCTPSGMPGWSLAMEFEASRTA